MTASLSLRSALNEAVKIQTINALLKEYHTLESVLMENITYDRDVQIVQQLDEMGYFDSKLQEKGNTRRQLDKNLRRNRQQQQKNRLRNRDANTELRDAENPDFGGFDNFDVGNVGASDIAKAGFEGIRGLGRMFSSAIKGGKAKLASKIKQLINKQRGVAPQTPVKDVPGVTPQAAQVDTKIPVQTPETPDDAIDWSEVDNWLASQKDLWGNVSDQPKLKPNADDAPSAEKTTNNDPAQLTLSPNTPTTTATAADSKITTSQQSNIDKTSAGLRAYLAAKASRKPTMPLPPAAASPVTTPTTTTPAVNVDAQPTVTGGTATSPVAPKTDTATAIKQTTGKTTPPEAPSTKANTPTASGSPEGPTPKPWTPAWVAMRRQQLGKMDPSQRLDVKDRAMKMTGHEPTDSIGDLLKGMKKFAQAPRGAMVQRTGGYQSMFREIVEFLKENELTGQVTVDEFMELMDENTKLAIRENKSIMGMFGLLEYAGVFDKGTGILSESVYTMDELVELLKEAWSFKPWRHRSVRGKKFGGRGVEKGPGKQIFPAPTKPEKEKAPPSPEPDLGTAANYRWHPTRPLDKVGLKRFKNPAAEEPKSFADTIDPNEFEDIMNKLSSKKTRATALKRLKQALHATKQAQAEPDPIKAKVSALPLKTGESDLEMHKIMRAIRDAIQVQKAKERMEKLDAVKGTQSDTEGSGSWNLSPAGEREVRQHAKLVGADYNEPAKLTPSGQEIEDVPLPVDGSRGRARTEPRAKVSVSKDAQIWDKPDADDADDTPLPDSRGKAPAFGTRFNGDVNTQHSGEETAQKDMKVRGQRMRAAKRRDDISEITEETLDVARLQFLAGIKPLDS